MVFYEEFEILAYVADKYVLAFIDSVKCEGVQKRVFRDTVEGFAPTVRRVGAPHLMRDWCHVHVCNHIQWGVGTRRRVVVVCASRPTLGFQEAGYACMMYKGWSRGCSENRVATV
eukprot:725567-Amphidinium_carterae.1